jgi:glycosyltransferase involved in cell wall biosynthesis
MDEVGFGERVSEPERERMSGVTADERERAKNADMEAARVPRGARGRSERHEPALDMARERTSELERVALAPSEDSPRAEERGSDVDDAHLVLPLVTVGDPRRLSGGYLYHLRMADAAPAHGARIVFVSFPDRVFPLAALRGAAVLRRCRESGASAVLLDSIAAPFAAPALATGGLDLPLVGVLHQPPGGIDHGVFRARAQARLDRLAWRRAELLIAASDHLAEELVEAGFTRSRIRVVPPGRDLASAPGAPAPDLRAGRQAALLTVANWIPRKGILEVLEAVARLPGETATLHLAGDDAADARYAARVRSRLAEPDLVGRVVVHGRLARDEVAALYGAADVFVLPAYREPYGTVWGEAMALGLPVVGWRAGNLPYLADDEREALLVAPGDVEALSRALLRLASDGALRARLGEDARRRASTFPTWDDSAALFFGAIRDAVESRRVTRARPKGPRPPA